MLLRQLSGAGVDVGADVGSGPTQVVHQYVQHVREPVVHGCREHMEKEAEAAEARAPVAAERTRPLGCDRNGAVYYDLGCAQLLAGAVRCRRCTRIAGEICPPSLIQRSCAILGLSATVDVGIYNVSVVRPDICCWAGLCRLQTAAGGP